VAEPIRVKVRLEGDVAEVRALIGHPMETGLRKDPISGQLIPLHFIQLVTVTHNDSVVLDAQWSQAMARNPYLHIRIRGAKAGDEIGIAWSDNRGESNSVKTRIAPGS
jgi:sulfur-oxidizing protein SoxZ